jgi:RecA-family ATPase
VDDPTPEGVDARLAREVARLDLRASAVRFIADRDAAAAWQGFDIGTSGEILARPADPPARIVDLLGWEASTLISAQRKTGKTTLVLNLARCLVLGQSFLNRTVQPVRGRVALLNFEVSARQIARWAADPGETGDGARQ